MILMISLSLPALYNIFPSQTSDSFWLTEELSAILGFKLCKTTYFFRPSAQMSLMDQNTQIFAGI
jgi:hypothetical protein